jgi:hypothetical protein
MSYEDEYEQEPDMNRFNEIMETKIIPRIDEVLQDIISEGFDAEDVAGELQKRLFNEEVRAELEEIGIDMEDCDGIEMNVYTMKVDDKGDLIEKISNAESGEDMAELINEAIESKDRYITNRSEGEILSFNAYTLKDPINPEDIEPISEDQFKEMLGG